jgi:uncharacterized protein YnzC (UPF0291/DUF896 family)
LIRYDVTEPSKLVKVVDENGNPVRNENGMWFLKHTL